MLNPNIRLITTLVLSAAFIAVGCDDTPPTTNYFQFGPDASSSSTVSGDDAVTSAGDEGADPFGDYLLCPEGWQPNSTGDACAPLCASGTTLNAAETGCEPVASEPVDVISPPAGDASGPSEDGSTGPDDVADFTCPPGTSEANVNGAVVCVSDSSVTVAGVVVDAATGEGIEGVSVSLGPLTDGPLVTSTSGHFSVADVAFSGLVTAVYSKAGYVTEVSQITLPEAIAGQSSILVDASQALTALAGADSGEPGSGYVGGKIYVATGPALGATVTLHNLTLGADVATTNTSIVDGSFAFTSVGHEADNFELRVSPFDADGDGIFDYVVAPQSLGPIVSGVGTSGQNLSNLVIVMEMPDKALYFANFVAPLPDVFGAGITTGTIINGLEVDSPSATIELHFGAEVDIETTDVAVFSHLTSPPADALIGGANVNVLASWDSTATVLTIDPVFALKTDENEVAGGYEVRLTNWSWADGSSVGDLSLRFSVRVLEAPEEPLSSPTPALDFSGLGTDDQPGTALVCDSRVCWVRDADAFVVFDSDRNTGAEDIWQQSTNVAPTSASYVAAKGVPLTWTGIEGATSYRVYARQDNAFDEDNYAWSPSAGWNVVLESVAQPEFPVPGSGLQVTVDAVLSEDSPSLVGLLDMGLSIDGEQRHPFAYDNQVSIAVTAIDADGVESTIDETKTITLTDTYNPGVEFSIPAPSDANLGGALGVKANFDTYFSEWMDADYSPTWQVSSGRVLSLSGPATSDWAISHTDVVPSGSPAGGILRAQDMTVDFKGSCSVLLEETAASSNVLTAASGMLFAGLTGEDVFFLNGSNPSSLALGSVAVLETIDTSTGVITMVDTLETYGGTSLPAGTFICRTSANALQGSAFAVSVEAGAYSVELDDSIEGFHVNQEILLFGTVGGVSLEKRTIIGMSPAPIGPGGVPLGSARLHLDFPIGQTATLVTVFGVPSIDPTWRKASAFTLEADHDPAQTSFLAFEHASVAASSAMVGDLLLIDLDGVWYTTDDRHVVRIAEMTVTPDDSATDISEAQAEMEVVSSVGAPTALPFGVTLEPSTALIIHLADSFQLSGGADTSQNFGLRPEADQFSLCDAAGTSWCRTNFASAGKEGNVTY